MTFATSLKKLHNKTVGQIKDTPPVINPRNEMKADNVCGRRVAGRGCRSDMIGTPVSQLSPANWSLGAGSRQPS